MYTSDFLSRVGLIDKKNCWYSYQLNSHLITSLGEPLSDSILYRQLVGSLVHLTVIGPNILYAMHKVSQFMSAPWPTYYVDVLRILWYVKGTLFHDLHFSTQSPLTLILIGQESPSIAGPLLNTASSLTPLWSPSETRNSLLCLALVLRLNIVPLLIPDLNFSGCVDYYKIWVCPPRGGVRNSI